jgi:hypothetical protein
MGHLFSGVAVFLAGILIVFAYFIFVWRRVGKDPERGPATPQYEPPKGISPAMMRYLVTRGKLDQNTVAATLVRLAQCGTIRIAKERNLYRISRTGELPMACLPEEKAFLDGISTCSGSLVVGVEHANKTLRSVTGPMRKILQKEYRKYLVTNSRYLWRMLLPSVLAAAGGVFFLDFPFHGRGPRLLMVYSGFVFLVLGVMLFVFYRLLKAPTPAGSKLMGKIEGFRKFLAANYEKPHAPRERPETDAPPFLEKHLPYAIALGIDSEYVSIRAKSLEWYAGRPGGFSAYDFTSSLNMKRPGAAKLVRPAKPRGAGADL